jgi:hypothetical protein
MTDQPEMRLWPFLTGRARNCGHRTVVVPRFLAGTALANDLAGHLGSGITATDEPPEWAFIQPLAAPLATATATATATRSLYAVFWRYTPQKADFGLGDGPLLDNGHRAIVVTEGLIVEVPTGSALLPTLTDADMRAAHAAVIPAYQRFWQQDEDYHTTLSDAVTPALGTVLPARKLQGEQSPPPPAPLPGPGWSWQDRSSQRSANSQAAPLRRAIAAVAGAALIAGAIGYALSRRGSPTIAATPAATSHSSRPSAPPMAPGMMTVITTTGPGGTWATGTTVTGSTRPLIDRWNGKQWVPCTISPTVTGTVTQLRATSPRNAWALVFDAHASIPTVLSWNGTLWAKAASPGIANISGLVLTGGSPLVFSGQGKVTLYDSRSRRWATPGLLAANVVSLDSMSAGPGDVVWALGTIRQSGAIVPATWRLTKAGWHQESLPPA